MGKFCIKCGAEMPKESKFCPKCGEKVKNSNSSGGKKKILPFIIGGGVVVLVLIIGVFIVIGSSDSKKMKKILQNYGYTCVNGSDYTTYDILCEKEESNQKRSFEINNSSATYEEILDDSGSEKVKIRITQTLYLRNGRAVYVSQGDNSIQYYPEHCTIDDVPNCPLSVGEDVYPAYKENYDKYKEYFADGKDKEYLSALKNGELSQAERIGQETLYKNYSSIKEDDKFTENVNDALRYYERILGEAGISLEKE